MTFLMTSSERKLQPRCVTLTVFKVFGVLFKIASQRTLLELTIRSKSFGHRQAENQAVGTRAITVTFCGALASDWKNQASMRRSYEQITLTRRFEQ